MHPLNESQRREPLLSQASSFPNKLCNEFFNRLQQFERALEWLDRGEQWCKEPGWSRGFARMINYRGAILIRQGKSTAAEPFLMQSLNMANSWDERRLILRSKHRLAMIYMETDRLQPAFQMAKEVLEPYKELGWTESLAEAEELLRKLSGNVSNE